MPRRNFSEKNELIYAIHHFSLNQDTREIFLHGFLDCDTDNSEIDYKNATIFLKNIQYLTSLSSTKPIFIHLFTVGGDWDAGMVIYDAISCCPAPTTIIIHGQAYSMGSIITQAAKVRLIMPNAHFMLHEGSTTISDTHKGLMSAVEYEKDITASMIDIYAKKCKTGEFFKDYTYINIKKFLQDKLDHKQDWYLDAQKSVYYGFIDDVLGNSPKYKNLSTILRVKGV